MAGGQPLTLWRKRMEVLRTHEETHTIALYIEGEDGRVEDSQGDPHHCLIIQRGRGWKSEGHMRTPKYLHTNTPQSH